MTTESRERFIWRHRLKSFSFALEGCRHVVRTQHNAWIHAAISIAVFALAVWLHLSRLEWSILVLTITAVWMAEFFNTAIEAMVDIATPEFHPLAKVAKDVAAAAVLVGAIGAVVIGFLVMGPALWARLFQS